jgi:hypothetical protein
VPKAGQFVFAEELLGFEKGGMQSLGLLPLASLCGDGPHTHYGSKGPGVYTICLQAFSCVLLCLLVLLAQQC